MLAEGEILKTWFYQASSINYGVVPAFEYIRAKSLYGGVELSFRTMTDGIAQGVLGEMLSLGQFVDIGTILVWENKYANELGLIPDHLSTFESTLSPFMLGAENKADGFWQNLSRAFSDIFAGGVTLRNIMTTNGVDLLEYRQAILWDDWLNEISRRADGTLQNY